MSSKRSGVVRIKGGSNKLSKRSSKLNKRSVVVGRTRGVKR
jgi:hypothetical protein